MENNSVSHRNNGFPAGLRVLVVDDDQVWLKLLEKMLIKCSYDVTTCCLARDALEMLRKKKDGFDIVISDVNMPDMDGFKLLEHVGLEMNLPVIMMSVDGETSRVMKGVQHGACDYLLKPVRMKELQNIWQHVIRKRMYKTRNSDGHESNDDDDKIRNGLDELEDSHLVTGGDPISAKKRKENENHEHDNQDSNDPSVAKKARIVWSVDLHQKFLDALNQIGFDSKVGPKKILDLMNVPWLTRENVASHLQKYRLYLSRLQKQNEPKASFATSKQSDITSKDPSTSFDLQDSMTKQQNQVTTCGFIQEMDPKIHNDDMSTIFSFLPTTKPKTSVTGDTPHAQKLNAASRTGFPNTFGSTGLDANYTSCKATVWDEEIPLLQFMQQPKKQDVHGKTYTPLSNPHLQIQANFPLYASVDPGTSLGKRDKFDSSNIHSMGIEDSNSFASNECPTSSTDLFSIQALEDTSTPKFFRDEFTNKSLLNMINHSLDQKIVSSLGSFKPTLNSNIEESGKTLMSFEEDPQFQALQDYDCIRNFSLNNLELLDLPLMELVTEFPGYSYDELLKEIFCFFLKINGDGSCS